MKILILDDSQSRLLTFRRKLIGAVVICVEHVSDCIREIEENEPFDYIFLDHDLDGKIYVPSGPGTGYEVAQWLKNHPDKMPGKVIFHTCNEKAGPLMLEELPDAVFLPGVFMVQFDLSDLDNIEVIYKKHIELF
jgi:CheY-like chemotaxis protein